MNRRSEAHEQLLDRRALSDWDVGSMLRSLPAGDFAREWPEQETERHCGGPGQRAEKRLSTDFHTALKSEGFHELSKAAASGP